MKKGTKYIITVITVVMALCALTSFSAFADDGDEVLLLSNDPRLTFMGSWDSAGSIPNILSPSVKSIMAGPASVFFEIQSDSFKFFTASSGSAFDIYVDGVKFGNMSTSFTFPPAGGIVFDSSTVSLLSEDTHQIEIRYIYGLFFFDAVKYTEKSPPLPEPDPPGSLGGFFDSLTEIFTWAVTNITSSVGVLLSNPFIWIPLLMFLITGGVIGLVMRLFKGG